eukprot:gene792-1268_t
MNTSDWPLDQMCKRASANVLQNGTAWILIVVAVLLIDSMLWWYKLLRHTIRTRKKKELKLQGSSRDMNPLFDADVPMDTNADTQKGNADEDAKLSAEEDVERRDISADEVELKHEVAYVAHPRPDLRRFPKSPLAVLYGDDSANHAFKFVLISARRAQCYVQDKMLQARRAKAAFYTEPTDDSGNPLDLEVPASLSATPTLTGWIEGSADDPQIKAERTSMATWDAIDVLHYRLLEGYYTWKEARHKISGVAEEDSPTHDYTPESQYGDMLAFLVVTGLAEQPTFGYMHAFFFSDYYRKRSLNSNGGLDDARALFAVRFEFGSSVVTRNRWNQRVIHAPERMSHLFHNIMLSAKAAETTSDPRWTYVIDLDKIHDGLDEIQANGNPFEGCVCFDDLNDCGYYKIDEVRKTFQESSGFLILIDLFRNDNVDENGFFDPNVQQHATIEAIVLFDVWLKFLTEGLCHVLYEPFQYKYWPSESVSGQGYASLAKSIHPSILLRHELFNHQSHSKNAHTIQ